MTPGPLPTPPRPETAPEPAPAPSPASAASVRSRRQLARQHQSAFEQLGRVNGASEEEMVAQVMALTAEPEGAPDTGLPTHTPTPTPAPAPAPTPAPAPAPTPGHTPHCGSVVCQIAGAPGPLQPWPFLACASNGLRGKPGPPASFVGPLPPWHQRRADAAAATAAITGPSRGKKRTRSTAGSGSASGSALPSKGWLGSVIVLQARIRGVKARARCRVLAESWRRLNHAIHNTGQFGEPRSGKVASVSRESASKVYGSSFSNSHGFDGVRGPRSTRGAGGKSKVSKSVVATDDPASLL